MAQWEQKPQDNSSCVYRVSIDYRVQCKTQNQNEKKNSLEESKEEIK